ncbi:MAG: hypothetical protein EON58_14375 [Alphaproteobacteria bacterium]|nr:MAG: hypothetical protein EON58_14375 [Alphaproteobacteria bacterium]
MSTSSSTNAQVGNYYGGPMGGGESNSVVHWHGVGHTIRFSMANGENFSLESLVLNANVMMGGSPMTSGTEVSYLVASTGESILLPPTGWNVPVTLQFPTLTNISHFDIVTETDIGCIGVDDVTVASAVPEPSAALLGALGGLFLFRRRR